MSHGSIDLVRARASPLRSKFGNGDAQDGRTGNNGVGYRLTVSGSLPVAPSLKPMIIGCWALVNGTPAPAIR